MPHNLAAAIPAAVATDVPPRAASAHRSAFARRLLDRAGVSWFVVAVLGQLIFAAYVVGFYWVSAVQGRYTQWNKVLPHGYVAGDTFGNLVVLSHVVFTVIVIAGGALQLVPAVRRRWPAFHRWNGRVYLSLVVLLAGGGLLMAATRGAIGSPLQIGGVVVNAFAIFAFAGLALHHARAGRLAVHRRWALRLFLAVAGVWFFRIGLMAWIVANRGPAGFDPETFTGPFLTFLSFAQYLIPLAVLELYLRAQDGGAPRRQVAVAALVFVATLVTAGGIAAATALMWLPRL